MKTLKKPILIKDKMMGLEYLALQKSQTHYLAVDRHGDIVRINKTQCFVVG